MRFRGPRRRLRAAVPRRGSCPGGSPGPQGRQAAASHHRRLPAPQQGRGEVEPDPGLEIDPFRRTAAMHAWSVAAPSPQQPRDSAGSGPNGAVES
jgi:hypothetical protein